MSEPEIPQYVARMAIEALRGEGHAVESGVAIHFICAGCNALAAYNASQPKPTLGERVAKEWFGPWGLGGGAVAKAERGKLAALIDSEAAAQTTYTFRGTVHHGEPSEPPKDAVKRAAERIRLATYPREVAEDIIREELAADQKEQRSRNWLDVETTTADGRKATISVALWPLGNAKLPPPREPES